MTEPEELGVPERRKHDLPVRDTGKIKASWEFSQHRAREAGWWPEEQGQWGCVGGGVPLYAIITTETKIAMK